MRRTIVTVTPPTPNGDFHVGHLAGPYLAGDAFSRYRRLKGDDVRFVSSADVNQSYVVTTAERMSVAPAALASEIYRDMLTTLRAAQISFDVFNEPDARHVAHVQGFFADLKDRGEIVVQRRRLPFSRSKERYLFESYAAGWCRTCWSRTAGAICEACGHPNDSQSLDAPPDDTDIEWHNVPTAVLEIERFRERLTRFYADKDGVWRPHILGLVRELLATRLPDYPLTYPSAWGVPAPFAETPGQVMNVWAEMLPGLMNSTALAGPGTEDWWTAQEQSANLVQFLGFDNGFFFSIVHPTLLWAGGVPTLPGIIITNEFLQLDGSKFSTSKRHLIWARDLVAEHGSDEVRMYLALINPEHQKTNFVVGPALAEDIVRSRRLLDKAILFAAEVRAAFVGRDVDPSMAGQVADRLTTDLLGLARFYEQKTFSLQQVAERVMQMLSRLSDIRDLTAINRVQDGELLYAWGLVAHLLPPILLPLTPGFGARVIEELGLSPLTTWPEAIRARDLCGSLTKGPGRRSRAPAAVLEGAAGHE